MIPPDTRAATERRMSEILDAWLNQPNNPVNRGALSQELLQVVREVLPADDLTVELSKEEHAAVIVTFTLASPSDTALIPCAVPCYNTADEEDFFFLRVRVPADYESYEEGGDMDHHHNAARRGAIDLGGVEVSPGCPVYDATSHAGTHILKLFADWDTCGIVDIRGNPETEKRGPR